MGKKNQSIQVIILAAGTSKRMGEPKQLLKIGQQTLLNKTIETATAAGTEGVVIVLGAKADTIKKQTVLPEKATIIENENWQRGMGTTLRTGLSYCLKKSPQLDGVIVLVCDQPYLRTETLRQLLTTFQKTKSPIVAAKYGEIIGVPALFGKELFPALLQLKADEGARKIIKRNAAKVVTIDFSEGIFDLDTPEAYAEYLQKHKK
ncbi:MAG: nucleotidyltransferase family protein [Bacteroidota bacterium]